MMPCQPSPVFFTVLVLICSLLHGGCTLTEKGVSAVSAAALAPSNEIEQIYYLGVFDPQEQVPQTIYRIRIHGQASALNSMRFGSGWVKADLVDSLTSQQEIVAQASSLSGDGQPVFNEMLRTDVQRKLIAFGPEGFRVSPKDHRLVVVMGSRPDAFFSAVDRVTGQKARMQNTSMSQQLVRYLFDALTDVQSQRSALEKLKPIDPVTSQTTGETK